MRVPVNKGKKLPPEPLSSAEIARLMEACGWHTVTGKRAQALIVLLWRGMLRAGESIDLCGKDIDWQAGTIRVLHGKGDEYRLVGLDRQAWAVLERWEAVRAANGWGSDKCFICTLEGKAMAKDYMRQMLPRLAKRAGIHKRVHAHGLRHTGAYELANEGVPLHVIQKQLGHRSLETTQVYIGHLAPMEVVKAMSSRRWDCSALKV